MLLRIKRFKSVILAIFMYLLPMSAYGSSIQEKMDDIKLIAQENIETLSTSKVAAAAGHSFTILGLFIFAIILTFMLIMITRRD